MSRLKTPRTFLIGSTMPDFSGMYAYLTYTNQLEYMREFERGCEELGPITLASFYAKLCYESLVVGRNSNITRVRDTRSNLESCYDHKHGSVLEHITFNFVTTDCSRILTHELVRHRVGIAYSQTSGRYVALDDISVVLPPEFQDAYLNDPEVQYAIDVFLINTENLAEMLRAKMIPDGASFEFKKKMTSAIRRFAPNGQTNQIGWTPNIRTLRHIINMRTSRHAEWEIRYVFAEVAQIILDKHPMALYGYTVEDVDGLPEYTVQ